MNKRLYKSNTNKVLFGTCGGIGEFFNIDPTVIRIIFIVVTFACGSGILIYLISSLIIPNCIDNFDNFQDFEQANKDYKERPKSKKKFTSEDDEFDSYFEKDKK